MCIVYVREDVYCVCGSREMSKPKPYQKLHHHLAGILMCIVYVREGVAAFNAMPVGREVCVDQEKWAHLGSIKNYTIIMLEP